MANLHPHQPNASPCSLQSGSAEGIDRKPPGQQEQKWLAAPSLPLSVSHRQKELAENLEWTLGESSDR